MKNFFQSKRKQKQVDLPPPPAPRAKEELQQIYKELCARAGQLQYKMLLDKAQLDQLNEALKSVNMEADTRKKLDDEAAKEAAKPAEVKND